MSTQQLENELWDAADQLRANSKLTASEYSMPVLGLIFLRHADNRFKAYLPEIQAGIPARVPPRQRESLIKLGFQGKAAIYLPEPARFDHLAALPQGADAGAAIDAAMDAIEADYDVLKGALPRGYTAFEPVLLADLIKIFAARRSRPPPAMYSGASTNTSSTSSPRVARRKVGNFSRRRRLRA